VILIRTKSETEEQQHLSEFGFKVCCPFGGGGGGEEKKLALAMEKIVWHGNTSINHGLNVTALP
jgi:hypothetical protein